LYDSEADPVLKIGPGFPMICFFPSRLWFIFLFVNTIIWLNSKAHFRLFYASRLLSAVWPRFVLFWDS
jgi:hypothetical protein